MLVAAMLAVALLVSIWQVRGSRFSLPLACVPLAIWVAGWREHAQAAPGITSSLKLAGAWLVSFQRQLDTGGAGNLVSVFVS